jgi:ketosteroid isomerase-like protein
MLDVLNDEGVDAALVFFAEDFHGVVPPELSAEPDAYDGHEGVRHYFATFREIVADLRFDADRILDLGEGHVVARAHITGSGRESGIPVEMRVPMSIEVRDGKVVRMEGHADWAAAHAAAADD